MNVQTSHLIPLGKKKKKKRAINKYVPETFGTVIVMCYGTPQRLSKVFNMQKRIRSGIYVPVFHASYKVVLSQACGTFLI